MKACYDLNVSPASYDFVSFLLDIERERLARGEKDISISFRRGPFGGFRRDGFWPAKAAERQHLHENIVLPMAQLLPSVAEVDVEEPKPSDYGFGVRKYGTDLYMKALGAGARPLRAGVAMADSSRLVTITLRECEHWPARNSNPPEWLRAASAIKAMGFDVAFVRDTRFADQPINGFETEPHAARNLTYRARLYASAYCNLFVNNGPAWVSIALDAPTVIVKMTTEELGGCYSSEYFAKCGLRKGDQLPQSGQHQRIVWDDDRVEVILAAFEEFQTSALRAA